MITIRNPRMGLLLIGSPRFKCLGEGTAHKTYEVRKTAEEQMILDNFREIGDVITPGIVYERQDVEKAVDLFFQEKVDCVAAVYLSWAEDFAWIRFLRDMPTVPIFFTSIVRERIDISDTNDEDEFVEIETYSPAEAVEMILNGEIKDGKTVAAVFAWQALQGKFSQNA